MPQSNKYVVKVQNRSGFDKSHRNTMTLQCGTITPILCDELIPGSRVNLKLNLACQLAPLVSDTFMNVKLKAEAFFVPMRLLFGSFEDFYCDSARTNSVGHYNTAANMQLPDPLCNGISPRIPSAIVGSGFATGAFAPGTLADYLGFTFDSTPAAVANFNLGPFLAYHLVWQEWYRNPRVQKRAFVNWLPESTGHVAYVPISGFPYHYFHDTATDENGNIIAADYVHNITASSYSPSSTDPMVGLADGVSVFALRQRNFGSDYFTNCRTNTQQGDMSRVVAPDNGAGDAEFTIAALRLMNSLQQYKERNNIPSPRMVDVSLNRYGVSMSDGVAQRPICLGSASYDVYSRGVDQTFTTVTSSTASQITAPQNPFWSTGATYGKARGLGSDFIIDDFEAKEPGYLLVNITLVPEASYSAGIDRMFRRYMAPGSITDMANPLLQNVGDQPVYQYEVTGKYADFTSGSVFGYQDRYSDFMYKKSGVHGLVRPSQTLQQFVLQRNVAAGATISDSFLQIPVNYFDNVMVYLTTLDASNKIQNSGKPSTNGFAAWLDSMLQYRVSMPLAEFSIPSLQNPAYEHGKTVVLRRNGQIF